MLGVLTWVEGADPGFQARGVLKKIAPSGGRRGNFWGISCEKSRFYAKKSYFFQFRREAPLGCILVFYPEPVNDERLTSFFHVHFNVLLRVNGWVEKQESGDCCPIYFVCVYIDYNYLYTTCI